MNAYALRDAVSCRYIGYHSSLLGYIRSSYTCCTSVKQTLCQSRSKTLAYIINHLRHVTTSTASTRVANIEARKYGTQKGGVDESPPQAKFFLIFTLL
jgi:hypothetical protein